MLKLIIISLIASCLAACVVDDNSGDWAQIDIIQAEYAATSAEQRFELAAQQICGTQAAWERVDGGIQCFTHRGARTGKVVQP